VATRSTGKRTTLADLMAAAALGAIDPTTEVVTATEASAEARTAAADATAEAASTASTSSTLSTTDHDCAIPGCRHGAAHGPTQPDRQVKLACPNCGAIVRCTARALRTAGSITCGDGGTFAIAARRVYTRAAR